MLSFNFKVYEETDLEIRFIDVDSSVTVLTLTTDYTVALNPALDGGDVTVTYVPPGGYLPEVYIHIVRKLPREQATDWVNNNPFNMDILEIDLDRAIMLIQEVETNIDEVLSTSEWKGDWATGTYYALRDIAVGPDNNYYFCTEAHTADVFATDLAAGKWALYINVTNLLAIQTACEAAQTAAEVAQAAAELAETGAETAQTAAELAETNSAASAVTSASEASDSAASALAASGSATTASNAASSASADAVATAADLVATNQDTIDTAADVVTTTADAAAASTSASNASTSETNAAASESTASTAASNASASASNASTSAGNAATSETNASTSASNASTSETNAGTSEINAAASETMAEKWAEEAEDVEVAPGEYSAHHWALKASGFSPIGYVKADGTVPLTANWDVGAFSLTALRFVSDQTTGTAPLTVASSTMVANLNADQLDGQDYTDLQAEFQPIGSLVSVVTESGTTRTPAIGD